jgi:hypothetical protein
LLATAHPDAWQEQSFLLEYHHDGSRHRYTPDILVVWGANQEVVEIKDDSEADRPENQARFALIRELLGEHGYRPVPGVETLPEGFLNFREAASMLGIRSNVVRGLVVQGLLTVAAGYRNGFSKLVPAKEVQRFAERYVAASVLAKRFNLNGWSLARYLRQSGTPLLVVAIPDEGKGDALFLRKGRGASPDAANTLSEGVAHWDRVLAFCADRFRVRPNVYCVRT